MLQRRITYRRRTAYRTKSNKLRQVKTPGGKLVGHVIKKRCSGPKTEMGKSSLQGVPHLSTRGLKKIAKNKRSVARAYGGVLTSSECRERITRAFLIEEVKLIKRMMQAKESSSKKSKKDKKKSSKK